MSRDGEVVSRCLHVSKIVGSNPTPATKFLRHGNSAHIQG